MRSAYKSRVDRVDHFFGDWFGHDRKKMRSIIERDKGPTKREVLEVCWEIMPKYTRLKGFIDGEGESIRFI